MMMMMAQCATFLNVSPNHGDPTAYITIMMCFIWYFGHSKSEKKFGRCGEIPHPPSRQRGYTLTIPPLDAFGVSISAPLSPQPKFW